MDWNGLKCVSSPFSSRGTTFEHQNKVLFLTWTFHLWTGWNASAASDLVLVWMEWREAPPQWWYRPPPELHKAGGASGQVHSSRKGGGKGLAASSQLGPLFCHLCRCGCLGGIGPNNDDYTLASQWLVGNVKKICTCWCLCDTYTWVTNITNDKREGSDS